MRRAILALGLIAGLIHGVALGADTTPVAANDLSHWRELVAIADSTPRGRLAADELARTIARIPDSQALGLLTLCQEKPNPGLIPVVASALQSDDPGIQAKALRVLRTVGIDDSRQADRVVELISAPHPMVANAAIETAGSLKLENSVPVLLKTAAGPDRTLVKASFAGLHRICAQPLPDAIEPWQEWYDHQQIRINDALPRIRRELTANEPRQVIAAMQELVSLPLISGTTVLTLTNLQQHPNPEIRQVASRLLDSITDAKNGNTIAIMVRNQGEAATRDAFLTDEETASPTTMATHTPPVLPQRAPASGSGWRGMVVLVAVLALILMAVLWLLRTPAARTVRSHVKRQIRHITGEIHAIRKAEVGTRRLIRPVIKSMHRR
jgi:hypothetical protein